jgi:hypothetical protein
MRCAPLAACAAHRLPHALPSRKNRRTRAAHRSGVCFAYAALRARQAVPLLIELMKDAVPQVKDTAAWCMCRICELHTPSIQDDNKMQVVMNVLVLGLADHAKVARWCVGALNVLTEHFADDAEVRCYAIRCLHGGARAAAGSERRSLSLCTEGFRPPTTD